MKIVALDVHGEWSQLAALSGETGEVLLEMGGASCEDCHLQVRNNLPATALFTSSSALLVSV